MNDSLNKYVKYILKWLKVLKELQTICRAGIFNFFFVFSSRVGHCCCFYFRNEGRSKLSGLGLFVGNMVKFYIGLFPKVFLCNLFPHYLGPCPRAPVPCPPEIVCLKKLYSHLKFEFLTFYQLCFYLSCHALFFSCSVTAARMARMMQK